MDRGELLLDIEADAFAQRSIGVIENDPSATGGSAWNLTRYGQITTTIDVPSSGVVWFDIRARGWHPADMRNPHMHILVDGVQRAEWDVRSSWLTYPQSVPILAGRHTISIENFDNYRGATQVRTLVVDWMRMTMPTLGGTPRVPTGGTVVVDAADIHNSVTGELARPEDARNGTAWRQWGIGCFSELLVFEGQGAHLLSARLHGDEYDGVGSFVQIHVDGIEVDHYFAGDAWADHTTSFRVASGTHMIEICYDNDLPGEKRELWLDEFSVTSLSAAGAGSGEPAWTSAHGSLSNHRYVPSQIDTTSVRTARAAWSYTSGPVTGTPAVGDGIVYFGDFQGKLHALRASDGSVIWSIDHGAGIDSSLALDAERIYIGDQKGVVSARARSDGSLVWRTQADTAKGTHLYGSPVLFQGMLYTGVASEQTLIEFQEEQTFRGSVLALNASDGSVIWRTYTQRPEGRGVSVWSTPAIDPDLQLLFIGTGNSYGQPISPLTDSILALRLGNGEIAWSYQATPDDTFDARGAPGPDRDLGASPLLFEAKGRKLVGEGDKGGAFFALDRATGELVWTVTAQYRAPGEPPSRLEGFLGTPSYQDGRIFAPTTSRSMVHAIDAASGEIVWARELNELPSKYSERMFAPNTVAEGVLLQGTAFGTVFALDATTGDVLANFSAGGSVQGGISVAGTRFFVPHVGADLWSNSGGVTAFALDPTGSIQFVLPTLDDPTRPPVTPTSREGGLNESDAAAIAMGRGIPGGGATGLIAALALVAVTGRCRRTPRK